MSAFTEGDRVFILDIQESGTIRKVITGEWNLDVALVIELDSAIQGKCFLTSYFHNLIRIQ